MFSFSFHFLVYIAFDSIFFVFTTYSYSGKNLSTKESNSDFVVSAEQKKQLGHFRLGRSVYSAFEGPIPMRRNLYKKKLDPFPF